jgi:hypothetical protein
LNFPEAKIPRCGWGLPLLYTHMPIWDSIAIKKAMTTTENFPQRRKRSRKKSHYPTPYNWDKIAWVLLVALVLGVLAIRQFGW